MRRARLQAGSTYKAFINSPLRLLAYRGLLFKPIQHALRRKRNLPQANSNGIENSIGDSRGNYDDRRLRRAARIQFRMIDQMNVDFGNVLESDYGIAHPVFALCAV